VFVVDGRVVLEERRRIALVLQKEWIVLPNRELYVENHKELFVQERRVEECSAVQFFSKP
jgi:hypothetical protein